MTSHRFLQTSAAALLIAAAANSAIGQTPTQRLKRPILEERIEPSGSAVLPEVVVKADQTSYRAETATTASRGIAEPILDTPRSIQVVTPQIIQDRKITDPQEAVQNVSGVQRAAARSGGGETYIVRGFRQQSLFK